MSCAVMATIAVGDVHGNLAALDDLLRQLKRAVDPDDVVVFLGDYIDRGPDTKGCIDALLALQQELEAEVVFLCGNHEDWMLRSLRDYRRHTWLLGMEPFPTIRSYSIDAAQALREAMSKAGAALYTGECALPYEVFFDRMPAAHIRFFDNLRAFYQSPHCLCTHAGVDPSVADVNAQAHKAMLWGTRGFPHEYEGRQTVIYGHRNNAVLDDRGWPTPAIVGRTIGLDTISHGVLTAMKLPEQRLFQSARHQVSGTSA
jgi:serine/threonine protein phosphatase 1